jgi:hypothetical protein
LLAGGIFVTGLLFAAISYGCAFFHFMMWQGATGEEASRRGAAITAEYLAGMTGQPQPPPSEDPTPKEARYRWRAASFQTVAVLAKIIGLMLFVVGAILTDYVFKGGSHQPK